MSTVCDRRDPFPVNICSSWCYPKDPECARAVLMYTVHWPGSNHVPGLGSFLSEASRFLDSLFKGISLNSSGCFTVGVAAVFRMLLTQLILEPMTLKLVVWDWGKYCSILSEQGHLQQFPWIQLWPGTHRSVTLFRLERMCTCRRPGRHHGPVCTPDWTEAWWAKSTANVCVTGPPIPKSKIWCHFVLTHLKNWVRFCRPDNPLPLCR
jgi:hypothetical protein